MCREVECTQERWESCEQRIAAEAARMGEGDGDLAEAPNRPVEDSGSVVQVDVARSPKPASS